MEKAFYFEMYDFSKFLSILRNFMNFLELFYGKNKKMGLVGLDDLAS